MSYSEVEMVIRFIIGFYLGILLMWILRYLVIPYTIDIIILTVSIRLLDFIDNLQELELLDKAVKRVTSDNIGITEKCRFLKFLRSRLKELKPAPPSR